MKKSFNSFLTHPPLPSSLVLLLVLALVVFSRVLRNSTPRFVGLSVGPSVCPFVHLSVRRSVGPSHFTFLALMGFLALLLLPKCSTDLNYGPCPPARDWGSRVSGLVQLLLVLVLLFPLFFIESF